MHFDLLSYFVAIVPEREYGFLPHITLAYLDEEVALPEIDTSDIRMQFEAVTLAWGDERVSYRFGQHEEWASEAALHPYTYNGVSVKASRRRSSTRSDKKYMRDVAKDGKIYVVHYGDPNLPMRRNNPDARRNFLARHNCSDKKDPLAPGFWACLDWERTHEEMTMTTINVIEQEQNGRILVRLDTVIEMGGQRGVDYPNIAVPDDVDVAGLESIFGEKPVFVILPIGQMNARSRNNRTYTESAMHSLVRQVNELRPEGMRGHLRDDEIGTRYDNPEIRWLRAEIHGDMVYGLAVALTKNSRDYYRTAMKTNAQVGTSLFAWAEMEEDNVVDLELISIDQADPRRVGIPVTAAKPKIKHEMQHNEEKKPMGNQTTEAVQAQVTFIELREQRTQLLNRVSELEATIARLAPYEDDARELRKLFNVSEQQSLLPVIKAQRATLAELFTLFEVNDITAFKAAVTDLYNVYRKMEAEAKALLDSTIRASVEQKIVVPSLRDMVVELVAARNPRTREEVDAALDAVYKMPALQNALAEGISALSGGNQSSIRSGKTDDNKPKSWSIKEG
jgi:hypothetical protein